MTSFTAFQTDRASQYLAALCKHLGLRAKAECSDHTGSVVFPFGRCELTAHPTCLEMTAAAETADQLAKVVEIMTSHLERYAFRENPDLSWQTSAS